jgi:hypothetical protein
LSLDGGARRCARAGDELRRRPVEPVIAEPDSCARRGRGVCAGVLELGEQPECAFARAAFLVVERRGPCLGGVVERQLEVALGRGRGDPKHVELAACAGDAFTRLDDPDGLGGDLRFAAAERASGVLAVLPFGVAEIALGRLDSCRRRGETR